MPENFIPLDDIRVAAPCHASWDNMSGGDTTRFCQTCRKNVYNLSKMSRAEAEALVRDKEGNLCVRFYRRADGTLLTDNCPVGLKIMRRPFKWLAAGGAALLASGVAVFAASHGPVQHSTTSSVGPLSSLRQSPLFRMVVRWLNPAPPETASMGKFEVVPIKPVAPPAPTMGKPMMPPKK